MRKNTSYSALRDSEARTTASFYQDLTEKTLKCIGLITNHDISAVTTILELKSFMGINYNALATIVSSLKKSGYITMSIDESLKNTPMDNLGPEKLNIRLTKDGLNSILKNTK